MGGGGGAYSITLVGMYLLHTDVPYCTGFGAISFEYIGVLDSFLIHKFLIIKCRSSLIKGKIHQLLSELWPLISI